VCSTTAKPRFAIDYHGLRLCYGATTVFGSYYTHDISGGHAA